MLRVESEARIEDPAAGEVPTAARPTAVIPLAFAVVTFGVSFGVLAVSEGVPGWLTVLMSALVFAGGSQFAALASVSSGAGAMSAFGSGVALNLRYLAMGAAVAPALPSGRVRRFLMALLVVDESYAMAVAAGTPGRPDIRVMLRVGAVLWFAWVGGTALGVLLGPVLGDPLDFGLDAAFPAGFLALLWPLLKAPGAVLAAAGGALVTLVLVPLTSVGVALAGAAVAGLVLSR